MSLKAKEEKYFFPQKVDKSNTGDRAIFLPKSYSS